MLHVAFLLEKFNAGALRVGFHYQYTKAAWLYEAENNMKTLLLVRRILAQDDWLHLY